MHPHCHLHGKALGQQVQETAPKALCQHMAPFCQLNSQMAISTQPFDLHTFKGLREQSLLACQIPVG